MTLHLSHDGALWLGPTMALALAACIPDQGSSYAPDASDDAGDQSTEGGGVTPADAGATDDGSAGDASDGAPATVTVTRKVFGTTDDKFVVTDENGKPSGANINKLYVPAKAHVHFIMTSDPTGEKHTFQITAPPVPAGFSTPNLTMPASPPLVYDWIAPPTPATYPNAVNCDVHKGMVTDLIVE